MIGTVFYSLIVIGAAVVLFLCGQRFPDSKTVSRLIGEGMARHRRRMLREFVDSPWTCVHVRKGAHCIVAELVSGERRISLWHRDIPHGTMVHFIECVDGADWNVLTPYLGGIERLLRMSFSLTEAQRTSDECEE